LGGVTSRKACSRRGENLLLLKKSYNNQILLHAIQWLCFHTKLYGTLFIKHFPGSKTKKAGFVADIFFSSA